MSVGTMLAGIGILIVLVAYVARPFRKDTRDGDLDQAIEAWVAQIESGPDSEEHLSRVDDADGARHQRERAESAVARAINYCWQCGRRVRSGDRFCSGCGNRLRRGDG